MSSFTPNRRIFRFLLLALLMHAILVLTIAVRPWEQAPEPELSGKFVKRRPLSQPVLQRSPRQPTPLPTMKRTVPAPSTVARPMFQRSLAPPDPSFLSSRQVAPLLPRRPASLPSRIPGPGRLRSAPAHVAVRAQDHLDLGLELLDVDALDTGRYRALVVQDPQDKRNLRGFVRFTAVSVPSIDESLGEVHKQAIGGCAGRGRQIDFGLPLFSDCRPSTNVRALASLATELEQQSGLRAVVDENVGILSPRMLSSPIILLTSMAEFQPTEAEMANLGRYLTSGGFAYVEQVGVDWGYLTTGNYPDLAGLRHLVRGALESQGLHEGDDWSFEPLPMDHPLFHCYYDIDTLPTNYWQAIYTDFTGEGERAHNRAYPNAGSFPPYIEGIHLNGRLVLAYSQQNYRDFWTRRPERVFTDLPQRTIDFEIHIPHHKPSSEPAIRLGINVVVYALTQEGSLARRYVQEN